MRSSRSVVSSPQSPDPRVRCAANAGMAIPTALYFHDEAVELHAKAAADLAIARESAPGSATEAAAAALLFSRAVLMAYARDYGSASQRLVEASTDLDAQHHVSTFDLTIRFDAAIYQILVGEAEAALRTLESLDLAHFAYAYGDHHDYRALAYLALGDQERAIEHLRANAALAATGLRPRQSNDSVLVLAALAHTEGDDDRARALLLEMGMGQTCATVAYSREFAERLGVGDEVSEPGRSSSRRRKREPNTACSARRPPRERSATSSHEEAGRSATPRGLKSSHDHASQYPKTLRPKPARRYHLLEFHREAVYAAHRCELIRHCGKYHCLSGHPCHF